MDSKLRKLTTTEFAEFEKQVKLQTQNLSEEQRLNLLNELQELYNGHFVFRQNRRDFLKNLGLLGVLLTGVVLNAEQAYAFFNVLLMKKNASASQIYVDDVFSAYTYTGNSSTQTINNGINLAGKGGLVWIKRRSGATDHALVDTVKGRGSALYTDSTIAAVTCSAGKDISSFNANGFSMGLDINNGGALDINGNLDNFISWTFRKAAMFFDVVTYTGNGANRTIAHSLGIAPGMILVKRTDASGSWMVYHRSIANTENLVLNTQAGKTTNATVWNSTTATASVFSLGTHTDVNSNGASYVAYLFAHDASASGMIQCGTFTGVTSVNLGWEPQYVMIKDTNAGSSWQIFDTSRLLNSSGNIAWLVADGTMSESNYNMLSISATSFSTTSAGYIYSSPYVYMAIRGPNKSPTAGTQVFNAIARTGTGAAAKVTGVGFAPDLVIIKHRSSGTGWVWENRLVGAGKWLDSAMFTIGSENTETAGILSFDMDGVSLGTGLNSGGNATNGSTNSLINYFFKRGPGVFDIVCDTGTGAMKTVSHSLGVVPELMIRKSRSVSTSWQCYASGIANTEKLVLNTNAAKVTDTAAWGSTSPNPLSFIVGTGASVNTDTATYVTYLFATKSGISKVGSYTGNGTSQTINCGFSTGARFILIKCASTTGDWFVWDTTRGIIAGNNPHLSFNEGVGEVTTDNSIAPDTTGFIVNQLSATNVNVTSATYIYLALA